MKSNREEWIVELTESDNEMWYADIDCNSREEAIEEGMKGAIEDGLESFRIGRQESCDIPTIDVSSVIEDAQEQLAEEIGEVSESYLDSVTKEQEEELEVELNEVFRKWHKKHNLFPTCYNILDEEVIEVNREG